LRTWDNVEGDRLLAPGDPTAIRLGVVIALLLLGDSIPFQQYAVGDATSGTSAGSGVTHGEKGHG
jgi:hypothetical protein